jgi:hypothetical protein
VKKEGALVMGEVNYMVHPSVRILHVRIYRNLVWWGTAVEDTRIRRIFI